MLSETENFMGNRFVGDVFDILVNNSLPVLFTGTFFGQQAFNGFPKKVAALPE